MPDCHDINRALAEAARAVSEENDPGHTLDGAVKKPPSRPPSPKDLATMGKPARTVRVETGESPHQASLEADARVNVAIGVLMERHSLHYAEGQAKLRALADAANVKVGAMARELVTLGGLGGQSGPSGPNDLVGE